MNQKLIAVAIAVIAVSLSAAMEAQAGGVPLDDVQLDAVTAGGDASFAFNTIASSGTIATTLANGLAQSQQAELNGQPHQQAEVSVAMGHASAVAVGNSPTAFSAVLPTSSTGSGPAVYSSNFGMTIDTPHASVSLGFSWSSTTTANPWALTGL